MALRKGLITLGITLLCSVSLSALSTSAAAAEESTSSTNQVEQTTSSTFMSTDSSTSESSEQETSTSTETSTSNTNEAVKEDDTKEEKANDEKANGEKNLDVKKGSKFTYRLVFQISNSKVFDSLVLKDDLEDVLKVHEAKVYLVDQEKEDEEEQLKDITEDGTLTIDQKTSLVTWEAKEPAKYFGATLYLDIVAEIKEDADLTNYKSGDGYKIPNKGVMITDDEETETDEVFLNTPNDPTPTSEPPADQGEPDGKKLPQTSQSDEGSALPIILLSVGAIGTGVVAYDVKFKKS